MYIYFFRSSHDDDDVGFCLAFRPAAAAGYLTTTAAAAAASCCLLRFCGWWWLGRSRRGDDDARQAAAARVEHHAFSSAPSGQNQRLPRGMKSMKPPSGDISLAFSLPRRAARRALFQSMDASKYGCFSKFISSAGGGMMWDNTKKLRNGTPHTAFKPRKRRKVGP